MSWSYHPQSVYGETDEDPMIEDDGDEPESREFDKNLPSQHAYLPGSLEGVQGRIYLEPGWTGRMPCWIHPNVIFPGEHVPMMFTNPRDIHFMEEIIKTDKYFGLLFVNADDIVRYGVVCEILEAGPTLLALPNLVRHHHMSFKIRATQRFRCLRNLQSDNPSGRRFICEVRIQPEKVLGDPLKNLRSKLSRTKTNRSSPRNRFLHMSDSICAPFPSFTYDIFNEKIMREQLKEHFKKFSIESLPEDLTRLSFWVATNLVLSKNQQFELFGTNNVLLRLHLALDHIRQRDKMLCCEACRVEICSKDDITIMSNEGLFTNYCNIAGYVHDILTTQRAINVSLDGRPTLKFTWFPGYYWTIAVCSSCGVHLGWRFTASNRSMKPQEFWGLSRRTLLSTSTPKVYTDY